MKKSPTEALKIDKYIQATPIAYKGIMKRSFAASASPRQAIKAKCLACCNYLKTEITECTVVICPLHAFRPYQKVVEVEKEIV